MASVVRPQVSWQIDAQKVAILSNARGLNVRRQASAALMRQFICYLFEERPFLRLKGPSADLAHVPHAGFDKRNFPHCDDVRNVGDS